jgi:hypothetical protein
VAKKTLVKTMLMRFLDLFQVIIRAGSPDTGLALTPEDMVQDIPGAQIGDFCEEL